MRLVVSPGRQGQGLIHRQLGCPPAPPAEARLQDTAPVRGGRGREGVYTSRGPRALEMRSMVSARMNRNKVPSLRGAGGGLAPR